MPLIEYTPKNFQGSSMLIIQRSNEILAEYDGQGLTLTLRQLYYQFVARDLFPDSWIHPVEKTKNHFRNYKKLQAIVNDARLAGLIDWSYLEDRTRNLMSYRSETTAANAVAKLSRAYTENLWLDQEYYVEVWVEKDALLGIVEQATNLYATPYFSCRGYTSQSEVWSAAQRFIAANKPSVVIHLGDHDPSGVDMTRDIRDRMELFGADQVEIKRVALTMAQVRRHNPPPNFAKETDSRHANYVALYGVNSWELDALEPRQLVRLIQDTTARFIDLPQWLVSKEREAIARKQLETISENYDKVIARLNKK
jgi:hypothetical protein